MEHLTVSKLITLLTQLVEEDPSIATLLVDMEGCDCDEFAGAVEVIRVFPSDQDNDLREVYLRRVEYDYNR